MQAIILAGGLGTRLQSVLPNLPKPMAPIHNKPFLAYLLDYLISQGMTQVIFSVHHLKEAIFTYFQHSYKNLKIYYVIEPELLGTGGAIAYVLQTINFAEPVFVLNGDTFVKLNYKEMQRQHSKQQALMTIALRNVSDCERYGQVILQDDTITEFSEKGCSGGGLINAGVYLLNADIFSTFDCVSAFSFEKDFLFKHLSLLKPHAFITNDYFIDIGIPEDYARAQLEMTESLR